MKADFSRRRCKAATAILEEAKSDSDIENILDAWTEKLSSNEDAMKALQSCRRQS